MTLRKFSNKFPAVARLVHCNIAEVAKDKGVNVIIEFIYFAPVVYTNITQNFFVILVLLNEDLLLRG